MRRATLCAVRRAQARAAELLCTAGCHFGASSVTLLVLLHQSLALVPVCSPNGRRGGTASDLGRVAAAAAAAERELGRNLGSSRASADAAAARADSCLRADAGDAGLFPLAQSGLFPDEIDLALRRKGAPVLLPLAWLPLAWLGAPWMGHVPWPHHATDPTVSSRLRSGARSARRVLSARSSRALGTAALPHQDLSLRT